MHLTLLESRRKANTKSVFGVGVMSLTVHTAVITGAIFATVRAARPDTHVKLDTTVVLLQPQPQQQRAEPPSIVEPLQGFQTVVVPTVIPTSVPPVDLQQHFDPKDYSGIGIEGGRAGGAAPNPNDVYAEAIVEEKPALLSYPDPAAFYPEMLVRARIQGRVILQAIVDTTGHVEANSIKILKSPNPGFNEPTKEWVLKALFRPARLHGQAVRVRVNLPVDYSVTS